MSVCVSRDAFPWETFGEMCTFHWYAGQFEVAGILLQKEIRQNLEIDAGSQNLWVIIYENPQKHVHRCMLKLEDFKVHV